MLDGIKKVLCFFAHTDDEMICAGTLHRLAQQGCQIGIITFSPAAIQSDRRGNMESLSVVTHEWITSLKLIGADFDLSMLLSWIPSCDQLQEKEQSIADITYEQCEKHKPDVCFILSPDDENPAHAVVGRQCERVMRGRVPIVIRCQFPWNYTIGRPNLFVSLSQENLTVKRGVINAYQSQKFRYDYETMLMNQCVVDGLSVKVPAAEKFELIRGVI